MEDQAREDFNDDVQDRKNENEDRRWEIDQEMRADVGEDRFSKKVFQNEAVEDVEIEAIKSSVMEKY